MLSILRLLGAAAAELDFDVTLLAHDALITRSRSVIVSHVLDNPSATHLLFVDADIGFETEQFFRLLRFDADFSAAFYPVKTIDWAAVPRRVVAGERLESAGLTYVGTLCEGPACERRDGFATAQYAGTGFQLIKRSVLERMAAAHPELHFKTIHVLPGQVPASDKMFALFDCMIDPDTGEYLSEDYAFCRRYRALGGTIWLDLHSRLTHTGAQVFAGDTTLRFGQVEAQRLSATDKA
jgi:hypothetical protein